MLQCGPLREVLWLLCLFASPFSDLGSGWVSHDAYIDISSQVLSVRRALMHSSEEHEQNASLDLIVPENVWSDRSHQTRVQLPLLLHLGHAILLRIRKLLLRLSLTVVTAVGAVVLRIRQLRLRAGDGSECRVRRANGGGEEAERVGEVAHSELLQAHHTSRTVLVAATSARSLAELGSSTSAAELCDVRHDDERSGEYTLITRFGEFDDIVSQDDFHTAWHRTRGNLIAILLNAHQLPVGELRQRSI